MRGVSLREVRRASPGPREARVALGRNGRPASLRDPRGHARTSALDTSGARSLPVVGVDGPSAQRVPLARSPASQPRREGSGRERWPQESRSAEARVPLPDLARDLARGGLAERRMAVGVVADDVSVTPHPPKQVPMSAGPHAGEEEPPASVAAPQRPQDSVDLGAAAAVVGRQSHPVGVVGAPLDLAESSRATWARRCVAVGQHGARAGTLPDDHAWPAPRSAARPSTTCAPRRAGSRK